MYHHLYLNAVNLYGKEMKDIDAVEQTASVFTEGIVMEFDMEKCTVV